MKKTLLLLLAFTLGIAATFAAKSPAEKAAGSYSGLLYIGMGSPVTDDTESSAATIKLEVETENTVKFTLPNFKYGSMNLGDIVLTGIPVSEDENGRIIFGKNDPQTLSISIATANVNIDETTSYIDGAYANVDVFVSTRIIFSNVNIYVRFQGNNGDYVEEGIAQKMEGTREGTLYNGLTNTLTSEDAHAASAVEAVADDASHIHLVLKDVELQGLSVGDITLQGISVSEGSSDNILLSDGTATGSLMGVMDYTATLVGAESYWSADSVGLSINFNLDGEMIYLVFTTGTLPDPVKEVTTGPASEVAGTYNAPIYIGLGTPVTEDTEKFTDADIEIIAEDENTVTFALRDFSLDGATSLGDIVLTNIPIEKKSEGEYTFGANEAQNVSLAGGGLVAQVRIDNETSYIRDGQLYIDVPVNAMGETIYVHIGLPVTTAIQQITVGGNDKGIIYDLNGRRVDNAQHGIYIIGGRKVIR